MYRTPMIRRLSVSFTSTRNNSPQLHSMLKKFKNPSAPWTRRHESSRIKEAQFEEPQLQLDKRIVMKQLAESYLMAVCCEFQQALSEQMQRMTKKMAQLELKIAQAQKKFNLVSLLLAQRSKQIFAITTQRNKVRDENLKLSRLIDSFKQNEQANRAVWKNQWLQSKIQEIKSQANKISLKSVEFSQIGKILAQNISRLVKITGTSGHNKLPDRQIVHQALLQITNTIKSIDRPPQFQIIIQKIKENIDLKFDILRLKEQNYCPQCKKSVMVSS